MSCDKHVQADLLAKRQVAIIREYAAGSNGVGRHKTPYVREAVSSSTPHCLKTGFG